MYSHYCESNRYILHFSQILKLYIEVAREKKEPFQSQEA